MSEPNNNAARCPKCESRRWMTNLDLMSSIWVTMNVAPRGLRLSKVRVDACADCGHVAFVLADPLRVWDEWRKHHK